MKIDLTRQSLVHTVMLFFLLVLIMWGGDFLYYRGVRETAASFSETGSLMPLGALIRHLLHPNAGLEVLVALVMLFINAFFMVRIVVRNLIYSNKTYVSALVFLLVCVGLFNGYQNYIALIAVYFLIGALEKITSVTKREPAEGKYFLGGARIGIASLIYGPFLLFFPVGLMSFLVYKRAQGREILSFTAGAFLPLFLCGYVLWAMGQAPLQLWVDFTRNVHFCLPDVISWGERWPDWWAYLPFLGVALVMFAVSLFSFLRRRGDFRTRSVKALRIFLWFSFFLSAILLFTDAAFSDMVPALAVSMAVIGPLSFRNRTLEGYNNVIFILLILTAALANVLPLIL